MDEIKEIEKELRKFLGWNDVHWVDDAFVVRCETYHLRNSISSIHRRVGKGWFVDDSEFSNYPISFLVELHSPLKDEGTVHQSWTWRGDIHRGHNRPAIVRWNPYHKILHREWIREGVYERKDDLPTSERLVGFEIIDSSDYDEFYIEKWRTGAFNWPEAKKKIGYPTVCHGWDGIFTKRKDNHEFHSPEEELSARSILRVVSRYTKPDGVKYFPVHLEAASFSETYDNGTLLTRSYTVNIIDLNEDDRVKTYNNELTETEAYNKNKARDNMEESPDLYNPMGRFFENDSSEFLWLSELM